jgi:hypothetical protein
VESSVEARRAAQTSGYAVSQNWFCFGAQNSVWGVLSPLSGVWRAGSGSGISLVSKWNRTGRGLRLAPSVCLVYYVLLSQGDCFVVRALKPDS